MKTKINLSLRKEVIELLDGSSMYKLVGGAEESYWATCDPYWTLTSCVCGGPSVGGTECPEEGNPEEEETKGCVDVSFACWYSDMGINCPDVEEEY